MSAQRLAAMTGWTPAECHNLGNTCSHKHTDGTSRCWECGTTSLSFEASARDWISKTDRLTELKPVVN